MIRPGDRGFFEPSEEHSHGATATRFMAHLAMLEVDDAGNAANWWGDHVSDEEHEAAPTVEAAAPSSRLSSRHDRAVDPAPR